MSEYNLRLTHTLTTDMGAYKLLELPPELCKSIESSLDNPPKSAHISRVHVPSKHIDVSYPSLVIKGEPDEDAVLCTADKTYILRSVVLSNSILVVAPPNDMDEDRNEEDVVIHDEIHDILELLPTLPRLQKLNGLLRNRVYDDRDNEDEEMDGEEDGEQRVSP